MKTPLLPRHGVVPQRDHHNLEPTVRESSGVAVGRIHHNTEQTVVEQIPRHTGVLMIECWRDCQCKFDGPQKWLFCLFVEGLPIMLQITPLLLTCGLP